MAFHHHRGTLVAHGHERLQLLEDPAVPARPFHGGRGPRAFRADRGPDLSPMGPVRDFPHPKTGFFEWW